MADTHKNAHHDNPALTLLRALVDHLEDTGHRDMPQVLRAREYLTSLEPPPKMEHPAAKPAAAGVTPPHNK